jgi:ElaB/YqjD/DUF883 family membrane-anchored ribosome-binding protein
VEDVGGIVENVGGIVENVKATVDTTLAAVRQGAAGTQASVEEIVKDVGGMVKDVKATVDTTLVAVRQGVAGTQASVGEMVEHVKGTVENTVATVQRTFDLPLQTEHHPWPMVGGAVLVGYMLGRWGGGHPSAVGPTAERATEASRSGSPPAARASSARLQPQQGMVSGMLEQLRDEMKDEISSLQSVAVGAVMSTLREMVTQAISTLAPHPENAKTQPGGQASDSPAQPRASMSSASANGVRA